MRSKTVKIRVLKLKERASLPDRRSEGAAGYDVYACLEGPVILRPLQRLKIPTGLVLEIPAACFISVRPRSSLALKHGITLINSPGTIDSDYRGELMIPMINLSDQNYQIDHGDRIAQLILEMTAQMEYILEISKDSLSSTKRGGGGFGSTGI